MIFLFWGGGGGGISFLNFFVSECLSAFISLREKGRYENTELLQLHLKVTLEIFAKIITHGMVFHGKRWVQVPSMVFTRF